MTRSEQTRGKLPRSRLLACFACALAACAAPVDDPPDNGKGDGDDAAVFDAFAQRYPTLNKAFFDEIKRIAPLTPAPTDLRDACRLAKDERRAAAFCADVRTFTEFKDTKEIFVAYGVVAKPATVFVGARAEYVAATLVRVENALRKAAPDVSAAYKTGALFDATFGLDQPTVFELVGGSFSVAVSDAYVKVGNLLSTQRFPLRQINLFTHELGHGFSNATFTRSSDAERLEGNHPQVRSIGVTKFPGLLDTGGVVVGPDAFDSQSVVELLAAGGPLADGSYKNGGEYYRAIGGKLQWVVAGAEPLVDLKRFNDVEHGFRCDPADLQSLTCGAYLMNVTISALPSSEEFADMFLNWAFDSFVDNAAGDARYNWVNDNVETWLGLLGV